MWNWQSECLDYTWRCDPASVTSTAAHNSSLYTVTCFIGARRPLPRMRLICISSWWLTMHLYEQAPNPFKFASQKWWISIGPSRNWPGTRHPGNRKCSIPNKDPNQDAERIPGSGHPKEVPFVSPLEIVAYLFESQGWSTPGGRTSVKLDSTSYFMSHLYSP